MNVLNYNPNHHEQTFPYIEVDTDKISKNDTDQVNIGLVFETDRNSSAHDDESIEPRLFKNIFNEKHNVICLDKYVTDETLPDYCSKHTSYSNLLELSRVIYNLDLVITVDHLVAHLAGALNIDTILMLPCVPNWRWDMNFRDTSVWYKSFKVIRQQTRGDWTVVMNKLSNHLSGFRNG